LESVKKPHIGPVGGGALRAAHPATVNASPTMSLTDPSARSRGSAATPRG